VILQPFLLGKGAQVKFFSPRRSNGLSCGPTRGPIHVGSTRLGTTDGLRLLPPPRPVATGAGGVMPRLSSALPRTISSKEFRSLLCSRKWPGYWHPCALQLIGCTWPLNRLRISSSTLLMASVHSNTRRGTTEGYHRFMFLPGPGSCSSRISTRRSLQDHPSLRCATGCEHCSGSAVVWLWP